MKAKKKDNDKRRPGDVAFIVYNYTSDDCEPGISLIWARDEAEVRLLTKDWKTDCAGTIKKQEIDIVPVDSISTRVTSLERRISFFD